MFASPKEFEEALAQMCRYYRALHEIWGITEADDKGSVSSWVRLGGKILEKLDTTVSDIEAYSGCVDLRIVVDELKQMRAAKDGTVERE